MTTQARPYPDEIPSGAYGDDGRPRFFADPAMDRLVAAFLDLASESWVLAERVATLEDMMIEGGMSRATLEFYQPDAAGLERRERARDVFIGRILGQLREKR